MIRSARENGQKRHLRFQPQHVHLARAARERSLGTQRRRQVGPPPAREDLRVNTQSMRAMQNPAVVVAGSTRPTHVLFGVLQMALHRVCRRQARVAGRLHSRATKMRPEKQRALRVMQRAGEKTRSPRRLAVFRNAVERVWQLRRKQRREGQHADNLPGVVVELERRVCWPAKLLRVADPRSEGWND